MQYLSQFTPAENLLLLKGPQALYSEQMKFTLMDLFFKKVLKTRHPADKKVLGYIIRGDHFEQYRPQPHEKVFLRPYLLVPDIGILFRHLVEMAYEEAVSRSHFMEKVKHNRLGLYFKTGFFARFLGRYTLNREGLVLRSKINGELMALEQKVKTQQNNAQGLQGLITLYAGNICLAPSFGLPVQAENVWPADAVAEPAGGCGTWSSCGGWSSFDSASGCGSGCSGSGCNSSGCSNSGCGSGCSGCGGGCGS